jgi:multidrug efflux pump subunit AcrA (membrane-fusion protein)
MSETMNPILSQKTFHGRGAGLFLLVALVAPLVLLSGCKKEKEPVPLVTVQAQMPVTGTLSSQVAADAILAPIAQAAIEPKITAPVKKIYVERGQRVKAGQLLAVLENSDLAAAAQDNQGSYESAQAAYATATKGQIPEDQLKAESDFAQAKANFDLAQSIVNSRKQLFAEGAIPGRDLDTAEASLVQAQAAYDAAKKHLDSMRAVTHEAALKQAAGDLKSAEGKLKGAQAQVSYSEIRSPIDGYVTDRPLFAGETAAAGTPLITVMETNTLLAKAHIALAQAQQLKLGADAQIKVPGIDDPVPAKVSMISPALDAGSTTVEVWLKIDNRSGKLKAGSPVKVTITSETAVNTMLIPVSAVLTAVDGSKSVMVVGSDNTAKVKVVTLGVSNGTEVEVLSGLDASDPVITTGDYGIDPGTKVKLATAAGMDEDDAPDGDTK